jgi:aerobic-type carbon monoxide dehydrogenase small subunit (CoxS/CutS family)
MAAFTLTVNGERHAVRGDRATLLLHILSDDLEVNGPQVGCAS